MKGLILLLPVLLLASCAGPSPTPYAGHPGILRYDPANRPALGLWEIDHVARQVAAVAGRRISGSVQQSIFPNGPVASIQETSGGDRILVNPRAAREIPLNAWAFIFGHEFAHQVYNFGHRGNTNPQQELRADIIGAGYARTAGYKLVPYLHWMLSRRPDSSPSHGDLHWRAREMARHFKVPTAIEVTYR
ncbi:hypothetical protein KBB96_11880 [Luteolibacter ambystomatis]|uniref:Peptidase M48 domain-containing protein n=1 Tax=Luteolibacter ambystomatis TaxID=2824561 RepID=A0A975IY68_9BACT|nr:hypothetical protein [Luteolibacter ambystomatis]QUE49573.1 hypothetical protein KBB96_11880 [Luteolibacter ambystomatis]